MDAVLGLDTSRHTTSAAAVDAQGKGDRLFPPAAPRGGGPARPSPKRGRFCACKAAASSCMGKPADRICRRTRRSGRRLRVRSSPGCAAGPPTCPCSRPACPLRDVAASPQRCGSRCLTTTHQQRACARGAGGQRPSAAGRAPYLALHLSGGGTTELLLDATGTARLTAARPVRCDLHAGQLVDRVGVRAGTCPSRPGRSLEKLAMAGAAPTEALLPASAWRMDACYCHLSGRGGPRGTCYVDSGGSCARASGSPPPRPSSLLARTVSFAC